MNVVRDYQEGLIKLPIYDATSMVKGQGLIWGVDANAHSPSFMIDCSAGTTIDLFAVLNETPAHTISNLATPLIYQAQCTLVDNPKVFKIYYDLSTVLTVVTATSVSLTGLTCDDNLGGSWIYIKSGTGAGQLRYCKTATTSSFTVNTAFTTTPDSTSRFILIRAVGRAEGGYPLDATLSMLASTLDATDPNIICLKNFMQGPMGTLELDPTLNGGCETDGLNSRGVRFFSHVIFADTAVHAQGLAA